MASDVGRFCRIYKRVSSCSCPVIRIVVVGLRYHRPTFLRSWQSSLCQHCLLLIDLIIVYEVLHFIIVTTSYDMHYIGTSPGFEQWIQAWDLVVITCLAESISFTHIVHAHRRLLSPLQLPFDMTLCNCNGHCITYACTVPKHAS